MMKRKCKYKIRLFNKKLRRISGAELAKKLNVSQQQVRQI
ncbi:HTH domain-containing protein [Providencia rettgeri]|uniref:HTH domain-containing protein n=1 Tax=Providencia rettgeri TaxID=587 RepID=A0A939SPD6_PRORE|nr:HTH domain-containing protein [Providencia rettgeri]